MVRKDKISSRSGKSQGISLRVRENLIHVLCIICCMKLAESINKWVEGMAVRGALGPLSGLICEIVNSVEQGNLSQIWTFVT